MSGNQPPPPPNFGGPPPPQPPGGGAPPPPPPGGGGYGGPPQPPGGGYGGYGGPPPQHPGGGYGGAPVGGGAPDVGTTVSWSWAKFQANMGQMIIAALAIFIGVLVVLGVWIALSATLLDSSLECGYNDDGLYECESGGPGFIVTMLLSLLVSGLLFIYAQIVGAGLIRGALGVANGLPFKAADVFKFQNIGAVIVTSLLVGAGVIVGSILCYVPGLIFGFLTQYSLYFLVDKNLSPVDSIKASIDLVKNNLGPTIIWYLVSALIITAGAVLCGVGLLAAIPVVLLGTAYMYKKLTGQAVAA